MTQPKATPESDSSPASNAVVGGTPISTARIIKFFLALTALVVIGLLIPVPYHGRAAVAMMDLVHTPMFAAITVCILAVWHRVRPIHAINRNLLLRAGIVFAVLACFGAGMELVQQQMGRSSSLKDAMANCFGITVGVLLFGWWILYRGNSAKLLRWCLIPIAAGVFVLGWLGPIAMLRDVVAVHGDFPLLASFETDAELQRWYFNNCSGERTTTDATDGKTALEVTFTNSRHASVTAIEMQRDWSEMADLQFDVVLDENYPEDGNLLVKVIDQDDASHVEMFLLRASLVPGKLRHFRITRDEIVSGPETHQIDLSKIRYFELVLVSPVTLAKLRIDDVRLTLR